MRHRSDRGSMSLELVILGPGLLAFIAMMIYAGRVEIAGQSVQHAAEEAARSASIARTQADANRTAESAARATLTQQGLQCAAITITVDTAGFRSTPGQDAAVTAVVTCRVRVGDLALPGVPGTKTVAGTAVSPIDTYREKTDGFTISDGGWSGNSRVD